MKNFYFFIFKKSRDLTGRLHFPLENWRFVGERLFLACVCAWLLRARLRAIARMIVRIFFAYCWKKYLLGVGFSPCVFFFRFYLVQAKLVLLIFGAFLQQKNAHANVAVYCGCLLVWVACSAWFKGLYINSCFLFLVGLFICFSCFFLPILATLILTVYCCRILDGHNSPLRAVCCSLRARFLLLKA